MHFAPRLLALAAAATGFFFQASSKAAETAADLVHLSLSSGTLTPVFARETTAYASSVPFSPETVTLGGEAASPATATIRTRLNGAASLSGLPRTLHLRLGLNRLSLRVTTDGAPLGDFPVAAGTTRNLAVHPGGAILQWAVGSGNTTAALPADTQSGVVAVFSGPASEYYLKTDGALYRLSGQALPPELTGGQAGVSQPKVLSAAIGQFVSIALREDGSVITWGNTLNVQSGKPIIAVAAGYAHALTLDADGRVSAWGNSNSYGELDVPAAARSDVVAVAARLNRNLALKADGSVIQWGQVTTAQAATPANLAEVVAIDLNESSNFALTRSGAVIAWGNNSATTDLPPPATASDVVALHAGRRHALAVKADGSIVAWGVNLASQPALTPSGFDPLFTPPLRDYRLTIDRAIPSPALSALATSAGPLSPSFSPDILSYAQSVPYSTTALEVSAAALASDTATVGHRANGNTPFTPLPSTVPLRLGWNQIEIRATAAGTPIPAFPFAANAGRNLAVSSAGAVMHSPASSPTTSLPAIPPEALAGVSGVFSGGYGEYALKTDGTLVRLSGGVIPTAAQPSSPSTSIISVAVGSAHALLLRADGTTYAWGSNPYGQTNIPADARSGVIAVACGTNHSIALRADGRVVAWGQNASGESYVPPGLKADVVAICAYGSGNYALRADGMVVPWGSALHYPVPAEARGGIAAVATNENSAYALTREGVVIAWSKSSGELRVLPAELQSGVVAIAAGPNHILALKTDGSVAVGGSTNSGGTPLPASFPAGLIDAPVRAYHLLVERRAPDAALAALTPALGARTPDFAPDTLSYALSSTPYRGLALHGLPFVNHPRLELRSGAGDFFPVVAGRTLAYNSLGGVAVRADGSVLAWGPGLSSSPASVQSDVVSVAAGYDHAVALKADGSVIAWGSGSSSTNFLPPDLKATAIAAGNFFTVVILPGGAADVFGYMTSNAVLTPPADAIDLVAIAAGSNQALGLRRDGRVVAWGQNTPDDSVPADARTGVVSIEAAGNMFLALRSDGRVVCWGSGLGSLGAVPPAATYGVVAISLGSTHALALKADGSVVSWNFFGFSFLHDIQPDIVAVVAGGSSGAPRSTAILRDGSLVQLDAPPLGAPAELSTGIFARPLSSLLPLAPGNNTVELRATARDLAATRTYTLSATRSAAPEIRLRSLDQTSSVLDGGSPWYHGAAKVGEPAPSATWTMVNTGDADLVIGSAEMTGVHAQDFTLSGLIAPLTLAPGEQISFSTLATPSATGNLDAAVAFATNLPHGAPFKLGLRVEGVTIPYLLATWRSGRFTAEELNNPALETTLWGNLADPDSDGLPNLLEYALETDPQNTGSGVPPAAVLDHSDPAAPRLKLTYTRLKKAGLAGLVYRVEWSDSLDPNSWSDAGVTEQVTAAPGNLAAYRETVTASVPADSPRRFLRLRVTTP